jgi:hypothetical protein
MNNKVTVVITSCERWELLQRTLNSFYKFNTFKDISEVIIVEDSGNIEMYHNIKRVYPGVNLIFNEKKLGQIASIDKGYEEVKTEWLFHLEDDWDFYREGFIEKSLAILESNPKILQVWLRELYDTNTQPIEEEMFNLNGITYKYVANSLVGTCNWNGFTWNPGLRRLSDYKLVAPFISFRQEEDFNALTEWRIDRKFYELGYRSVILAPEGYVRHIGYGQKVGG